MKVLFIVPYSTEGPSNRYRVEQYIPYLKERGIECSLRPFILPDFFKILYKKNCRTRKIFHFFSASIRRLRDIIKARGYDLIFIHIESFPFGPPVMEYLFSKLDRPIIYDFEDAVYLPNFRGSSRFTRFLRCPQKFYKILAVSSHVVVCNRYMMDLVRPYNRNITIIPTSIDTDKFRLRDLSSGSSKPVIGWIGSHTTSDYLEPLKKIFKTLCKKYDFSLRIIGGREDFSIPGVEVVNEKWTLAKDVENFQALDIGVYPLPDDERSKAKTPFKTVQYMAVGAAPVVSRVGGNMDIVQDGVNGFLASSEKDWIEKISLLIEDFRLRRDLAVRGRETVKKDYSLKVSGPKLVNMLERVYHESRKRT